MRSVFFTGFPGFLGMELLPRVLLRESHTLAVCLVQPKFAHLARERAGMIQSVHPSLAGRIEIEEGDITRSDLGLGSIRELQSTVRAIYHLAAIYDLNAPREVGMRINVNGTRHVLEFAAGCSHLEQFHYVSTCYVSGRYDGRFSETDLDVGQRFNNFYEETKFLAEVEVRTAAGGGLPATIYRPAVVVGDSRTGVTQKYDGPYYVMRWLLKQPRIALLPVAGNPKRYTFNVVPRDFVVEAISYLSSLPSRGLVYQIADPDPLTVDATIDLVAAATHRKVIRIPVTKWMAKQSIQHVPGVYRLMKIPANAVDYFVHPTTYDTTSAVRDLTAGGIRAPRLPDYVDNLVAFMKANPDISSAAMA